MQSMPIGTEGTAGWRQAPRRGFTMIEVLVVVAIILILTGVIYRVGGYMARKTGRAQAVYQLELLHNVLEEYYAVYGQYPPASGIRYVDNPNLLNRNVYPPTWGNYVDLAGDQFAPLRPSSGTGLVYYLIMQYFRPDAPGAERTAFAERWADYFADGQLSYTMGHDHEIYNLDNIGMEGGDLGYSNYSGTIGAPGGFSWVYSSDQPYQSYHLYLNGPDGPVGKDRWSE